MFQPMDDADRTAVIAHLEEFPERVPFYVATLETVIADLVEAAHRSSDPMEKTRLALLEMRATRGAVPCADGGRGARRGVTRYGHPVFRLVSGGIR
jgi:hypothetical protein